MKKKALVLAVCMAFTTPTISLAKALPSDFVGSSLGEIQSQSFLNEPFKGIIPILFTDINDSKLLSVTLAPASIFQKIGAEKLAILNDLQFEITVNKGKPVIAITSNRPIQMPFLNFVLEVTGPQGNLYQDYTTLLDPKSRLVNNFVTETAPLEIASQPEIPFASRLKSYSSASIKRTHKVKSGDTLSEIAQALNAAEVSLKKMVSVIHKKNPNAFVNNNIHRLKAGATLNLPSKNELMSSADFKAVAEAVLKNNPSKFKNIDVSGDNTYTVKRGDNLSTLTKSLGHKDVSFTRMMNAIHTANPHAFSKNKINLLKVGKVLTIPSLQEISSTTTFVKGSVKRSLAKQGEANNDPNLVILPSKEYGVRESGKEFLLGGFIVEKGDTLAKITKQIGHKSVSYSKMMHAIYIANPDAFEQNNITTLIEGAMIRLPSLKEVEALVKPSKNTNKLKSVVPKVVPKNKESKRNNKRGNATSLTRLEKRVRELKRDLGKAHTNLSVLESTLTAKESLLKQQNNDLSKLVKTLNLLKNTSYNDDKDKAGVLSELSKVSLSSEPSSNIPPVESASSVKNSAGNIPIERNFELASFIAKYSQYMSGKEMTYSALALLFGLFLIRYRRQIYAYTNISYDHPNYYPPFGEKEARELLKEKSIHFNDTLMDEVALAAMTGSSSMNDNKSDFTQEQLSDCERLADELIEDLNISNSKHSDNVEWESVDKACDDYIPEHESNHKVELRNTDNNIIEGTQAEPEETKAFAKGVISARGAISNKPTKRVDEAKENPMIYNIEKARAELHDMFDDELLIPFDKSAKRSKEVDENRL